MGRIKTWIDRARQTRPGRRRAAGTTARRRSLAFEQYESRLALSAATQTFAVEIDSATFVSHDEWVGQFLSWREENGRLAEVSSARLMTSDDGKVIDLVRVPLGEGFAISRPGASWDVEGGLISFSYGLETMAMGRFIGLNASGLNVSGTTGRAAGLLQDAFQSDADGATFEELSLGAYGGAGGSVDFLGPASAWDLSATPPLGALDGFQDRDYGSFDGRGAVEEPLAINIGPQTASPPVLRITIPAGLARSEGGVIDLTAMAGPTSLTPRESWTHMAATEAAPAVRMAVDRAPARAALPVESLRARAVVFEVAYADDEAEETADGALRRARNAAARGDADDNAASRKGDAAKQASEDRLPADEAREQTETANAPVATNQDAPPSDRDAASRAHATTTRDEALAAWDDDSSAAAQRDAAFAFTGTSRQKAGLALALAVGAGPLVKRARRAKLGATVEQASDPE